MPAVVHEWNELTVAVLDVLSHPPMTKMTVKLLGQAIDARYVPGVPYETTITDFAGQNGMKELTKCLVMLVDKGQVQLERCDGPAGAYGGDLFYVTGA